MVMVVVVMVVGLVVGVEFAGREELWREGGEGVEARELGTRRGRRSGRRRRGRRRKMRRRPRKGHLERGKEGREVRVK